MSENYKTEKLHNLKSLGTNNNYRCRSPSKNMRVGWRDFKISSYNLSECHIQQHHCSKTQHGSYRRKICFVSGL